MGLCWHLPARAADKAEIRLSRQATNPNMPSLFEEIKNATPKDVLHPVDKEKEKDPSPKVSTVPGHYVKQPTKPLSDDFGPQPKLKRGVEPPSCELKKGRDWCLENYKDHKTLVTVDDVEMDHNICLRDCDGVTAQVTKKCNNATIDRCKNTNLILTDLISTIELIHCERVKIQVTGTAPSIAIDNCDGVTIYLSDESRGVSITTSKAGEVNVCFPSAKDKEDFVELAIPVQFVSRIKDDNIVTDVSDHYKHSEVSG